MIDSNSRGLGKEVGNGAVDALAAVEGAGGVGVGVRQGAACVDVTLVGVDKPLVLQRLQTVHYHATREASDGCSALAGASAGGSIARQADTRLVQKSSISIFSKVIARRRCPRD